MLLKYMYVSLIVKLCKGSVSVQQQTKCWSIVREVRLFENVVKPNLHVCSIA